jgi:hypothetical protein
MMSLAKFCERAKSGELDGVTVIVDNDCVDAYRGLDHICNFDRLPPRGALIALLNSMGLDAELP